MLKFSKNSYLSPVIKTNTNANMFYIRKCNSNWKRTL